MESKKLIQEIETEEFIDEMLDEETELFERKTKKDKEKLIVD
jgi:hypothetical protein